MHSSGEMKLGNLTIRVEAIVLILLLVASAAIGSVLLWGELRAGGMEPKWTFRSAEQRVYWDTPLFQDEDGSVVVFENGGASAYLLSLSASNGTLEWKSPVNARPSPVQGPDGGFYYVDWSDKSVWEDNSSRAGSRNITALDSSGRFIWDFVADNGTFEIWGIYSDGDVIAHHDVERYNSSRNLWEFVKEELLGISRGTVLWRLDMPFENSTWRNPRVDDNGTFVVRMYNFDERARYEEGISRTGEVLYIEKGDFFTGSPGSPKSRNGTVEYEVRQEYIDNETSVIRVYAISLVNGSVLWKKDLLQADNPDHRTPGPYLSTSTLVDGQGRVYCDAGKYSYVLDSDGKILWQKPYLGIRIAGYPSGGFLLGDEVSLKRIDGNGSQVWRHYAQIDAYSAVLGQNETIYYSVGSSVTALTHSTGLSTNAIVLWVIVGLDVVAVIVYVLAIRGKRQSQAS